MPNELISALKERAKLLGIKCEQNDNFENCYRFDNINTLITTLETPEYFQLEELRDYVLTQVEKYLNIALNLRKELSPSETNDIQLIYICTPNETNSQLLKDLGYEIERDDRVCRKFLWQKGKYGKSVGKFLEKTFLARPWENAEPANADALHALIDDLGSNNTKLLSIILDDNLEGEDFVKALMGSLEEK